MTLIGIGHIAQTGKSTSAEGLKRDLQFTEISFADPLKRLALLADPLILANHVTNVGIGSGHLSKMVHSMGWEQAKRSFPEVRKFLQNLGAGCRDSFGDDFWLDQALKQIPPNGNLNFVIADVRYRNEFDAIKERGGFLIKIVRPGYEASGHESETELLSVAKDKWDAIIPNDSSVMELQAKVVSTVRQFMKREANAA